MIRRRYVDPGIRPAPSLGVGEPGALAIDPNNTDIVYVGTSARVAAAPAGGAVQVDRRRRRAGYGSARAIPLEHRATPSVRQPVDQRHHRRSGQQQDRLPRVYQRLLPFHRWRRNWTPVPTRGGDVRSLVLDTSSPAGSRILYAGITGRGVFQSTDGGQNWTPILSGDDPGGGGGSGPGARGLRQGLSPSHRRPRRRTRRACRCSTPRLRGRAARPTRSAFFMSTDQGATWTQRTATGMPTGTQGGYSFHMAVDPGSPATGPAT